MASLRFIRESNLIEGITREPTADEMAAAQNFMGLFAIDIAALGELQSVFAPDKPIRERPGMNVRVGDYVAPAGGPDILTGLIEIVERANSGVWSPWRLHVEFEMLHPYLDGNGRTGRMLWAWRMQKDGRDPFALPFLHRFYYQTLEARGSGK